MNYTKTIGAIAVLSLLLGVLNWFHPNLPRKELLSDIAGAPGNMLVEDYDPYWRYNGGLNTAKDVTLAGTNLLSGATSFTSTATFGSSGTALDNVVVTTCNPTANTSIAATSTGYIFCTGVTGITSSDNVFASFSTSTTAIADNWVIVGAKASTTAGAVDIKIMNLTGTAAVPSAASTVASSTKIFGAN